NPIWAGKVVNVRYDKSNVAQITARGLCEFAYDLPVDVLFGAQNLSWSPQSLWIRTGNIARQHWSRLIAESESITSPTIPEPIDLRGRTLGDVWRLLLQLNSDVIVKASLGTFKGVSNRLLMKLSLRSTVPVRISAEMFSDFELEYDSRHVVTRLFTTYRNEEPKNLLPEFSFEDATSTSWERLGSGSGWSCELVQAQYGAIYPWCFHASMLAISIPQQSPAGSVTVRTREKVNFGESTRTVVIGCWVRGYGGTIQSFVGSTYGSSVNLNSQWQWVTWSFNVSGQYQVGFRINGSTTTDVWANIDGVVAVAATSLPIFPPLIFGATETTKFAMLLSEDMIARVLDCFVYSGSTWQIYAPASMAWSSNLVGRKVEIYRWGHDQHVSERVVGTITQVLDSNTIRVNITENPDNTSAGGFRGGVIRLLEGAEAYYGVRYQSSVVANNHEAFAMMKALVRPQILLRGMIHKTDDIIPVDCELVIPEFANIQESFPVVSNTLIVKSGELIAQKIEAGSQELTLRGFMRKIQKQMTEYVQTR
ncbi:MAG: hypothetical protein NZ805_07820, partial [Armatimonadetes bacterium]|nr:hypothetical protein [Armatimonadota bacterium]